LATSDGGFILVGGASVIKLNANGNIAWQKSIPGIDSFKIIETSNGKFIVYGTRFNGSAPDICFLKMDSSGNVLWSKSFGGPDYEWAFSILETSDLGYTMGGTTFSFGTTYSLPFLMHVNSSGTLEWFKVYQTTNGGGINDMKELNNGNIILIGTTFYNDTRNVQVLYFKTDSSGNVFWARTAGSGGWDEGRCVAVANDQSTFLGGNIDGISITKLDTLGFGFCAFDTINLNVISPSMTINTENLASSASFIADSIISSSNAPYTFGPVTFCTDVTGIKSAKTDDENNNIVVFPNPFTNYLNITSKSDNRLQIILFDITSRELLDEQFSNSISIKTDELAKGFYFYKIINKNKTLEAGKIVKN
jgi:hypothetical protein